MDNIYITFENTSKGDWLRKIREIFDSSYKGKHIVFAFDKSIKKEEFLPFHLVTLANVIQYLFDKENKVYINSDINKDVYEYVYKELKFSEYWSKGKNHVESQNTDNIFNLWRYLSTNN